MSSATFFQSLIRRFAAFYSRLFVALREPAQMRNLLLFALVVIALLGLRQLNCVPFRLKLLADGGNDRIETVTDLWGSYYLPIRGGEDVGQGVRYHSMQDALEAYSYSPSPSASSERTSEQPFTVMDVKRWVVRSNGIDDKRYTDAEIETLWKKNHGFVR